MCGIAVLWGDADVGAVRNMLACLRHRGPDGDGLFTAAAAPTVMGHTRLAIIDTAGGAQPILNGAGDRSIVANGEIYNYRFLREMLGADHFITRSDTEVVLRLFEREGAETVRRLDGMFAFVIQDGAQVFAARDPVGIKPLYYGRRGAGYAFASEIKALIGRADDIREFPPATLFHSATGFRSYYSVPAAAPATDDRIESLVAELRAALKRAVGKWLVSDVPVGAFLSGGLDSSLIAALARRHAGPLHTFSVGAAGSRDLEAARQVARHIDSTHHELTFTAADVAQALPAIIYHLESDDPDLMRSAIPCYFAAKLASEHVKVVLTGEGADELFAGYTYYRRYRRADTLASEITRSIAAMHNVNLQRVDRMAMAHGLEARVPFLDGEVIACAQRIPVALKLRDVGGRRAVEKWILRAAASDLLPDAIVWRDKMQFDEGSGMIDLLPEVGRRLGGTTLGADDGAEERRLYADLLRRAFNDPAPVLANRGVWSVGRIAPSRGMGTPPGPDSRSDVTAR